MRIAGSRPEGEKKEQVARGPTFDRRAPSPNPRPTSRIPSRVLTLLSPSTIAAACPRPLVLAAIHTSTSRSSISCKSALNQEEQRTSIVRTQSSRRSPERVRGGQSRAGAPSVRELDERVVESNHLGQRSLMTWCCRRCLPLLAGLPGVRGPRRRERERGARADIHEKNE